MYNQIIMKPERILVIEDSKFYMTSITKRLGNVLDCQAVCAASFTQARDLLEQDPDFFAALVDLQLPDADAGQALDLVLSCGVPPIVLTADYDNDLRETLVADHRVVDYVFKQQAHGFQYITDLIKRLMRNRGIKIAIAEDSKSQRYKLKRILETHKFQVLEAGDGDAAFQLVKQTPDVKLVITDYNMPVVDGFELLTMLRRKFHKEHLGIIGLSAEGNSGLSSRFLKMGANDFLTKPFGPEELVARVNQNLEMMEMLDQLKTLAIKDPLTKLYNRRYLFDEGEKAFHECRKCHKPLSIAMLDIDHFKKVNDEHGHDAGDAVLKAISELLIKNTRGSDIVARYGGEEFCVLAAETDAQGAGVLFEKIRKRIQDTRVPFDDKTLSATVSIGIASGHFFSLADMLRHADQMLYAAKAGGRNKVMYEMPV
jgi:diguanylate cyclase (GGDEF)-like protein